MTAYMISQIEITDPIKYEGYKALTPAAITAHGGRFVVRGGPAEVLEGAYDGRRLVVVEFPSMEAARAFYNSEQYGVAREARAGAAVFTAVLVEGS